MKENEISKLQTELDLLLKKHQNMNFSTLEKAKEYQTENKSDLLKIKELREELRSQKWKMMTESEKADYLKYIEESKEKHSDE